MTVQQLKEALSLKLLAGEEGLSQEVSGCYIGDLLSWVMGRAKAGDAWLTVMGNISALAVASLADTACIILTENAWLIMRVYYDLHIHSCLSPCGDNDMTPNNIVNMSLLNGMDMIALTDHNSCKNCRAAVRAGEEAGVTVVPGMELTTSEEAHVVCLFPTVEQAEAFGDYVESRSPEIRNRPEIFGDQLIMDWQDEVVGRVSRLLINASSISVGELPGLMAEFGGAAFPAHIDHDSYSVISSLGAIPAEAEFHAAEISGKGDKELLLKRYPELQDMILLLDSDAHYLDWLKERRPWLDLPEKTARCLVDALNGKIQVKWER